MPDRDPRFPPGWWILFGAFLGLLIWVAFVVTAIWLRSTEPVNQSLADVRDGVLTVGTDDGGRLDSRLAFLDALRAADVEVRVTGKRCVSACTLYLGLPETCISPRTVFGFHGPSSQIYGIGLSPAEFEDWSRRMADEYPPALARWFMAEARHVIVGTINVRGAELIRLGWAKEC